MFMDKTSCLNYVQKPECCKPNDGKTLFDNVIFLIRLKVKAYVKSVVVINL